MMTGSIPGYFTLQKIYWLNTTSTNTNTNTNNTPLNITLEWFSWKDTLIQETITAYGNIL